jgi:hypothetical protein
MGKDSVGHERPQATGSLREYEEAIRRIRDVMAVRLVAAPGGAISEIHVLSGSSRSAKQIVRDIESSLMAKFGLSVDHKKISVAQVDGGGQVSWGSGRLRLLGVRYAVDSGAVEAEVKVEFEEVVQTATVSRPATAANRLRVPAEAVLNAVSEYFNSNHRMALDDVLLIDFRGWRIALSAISLLTPEGEETLIGTSLVRSAEAEAAARSALDAVNRRFTLIVRRPETRREAEDSPAANESEHEVP